VIRKASIQVVTKPKHMKSNSSGAKNKSELRRAPRGTGEMQRDIVRTCLRDQGLA